jgi:hypothetical protein
LAQFHFKKCHDFYQLGVTIGTEDGTSFMIATPEKALCDLMVYTPNLNLRYQTEIRDYLKQDIRFDMDALSDLNLDLIKGCATVSHDDSTDKIYRA